MPIACSPRAISRVLAAATMALVICTSAASAQVLVLRSTAPQLQIGKVLPNSARISLPGRASVTIVLPSGEMRTLNGPYEARISDLIRGSRSDPAVFEAVRIYVSSQRVPQPAASQVDGVRRMASRAPATRAPAVAAPAQQASRYRFSWHDIPVAVTGDICVEKGARLTLVRERTGTEQTVTVVNMNSANRAQTRFGTTDTRIPWPADLRPESGSFSILLPNQQMRQIRLRLIEPLPAAEQILRVLHGQRCKLQFQAYLRGVMVAQR
jgi:hypothetical protein